MASGNDPPAPALPRGILGRRGTPVGKDTRLSSLRGPRDLTLGGAKKKTFTPNIPSRREKGLEEKEDAGPSTPFSNQNRSKRETRGRGRGRGRGKDNVVQSKSIFEEGPSNITKKASSYSDPSERSHSSTSSGLKREQPHSREESKKILDHLLRDDFVVDDKLDTEDPALAPVCLPMTTVCKIESKPEVADSQIKVKEEPMDVSDSASVETEKPAETGRPHRGLDAKPQHVSDLFTKASTSEKGELIFMQLPDTLPGEPSTEEDNHRPASSSSQAKQTAKSSSTKLFQLSDFNEGFIGKLRVHKSGRTSLQLGNIALDVNMGTPPGFLQELVSLRTEDEGGSLTVLGQVQHKLLCLPDFESLLEER